MLPRHYPGLDGLRGLAILLVLLHMLNLLNLQDGGSGLPAYVYSRLTHVGWTGVQLFFVLSGFLITGILLDSQRALNYYSGFYARRVLRIFPLYFAVLAVAFIVLPAAGIVPANVALDRPHQFWLWTYLSNWAALAGQGSKAFPHFWSLALEEQFYLIWPLLVRSRTPAECVRFSVGVAVASLALRTVLTLAGVSDDLIYENSFCRMDALALGGAAAAALRIPAWKDRIVAARNRLLLASLAVAVAGTIVTRGFWTGTFVGATVGYTLVSLIFVLLLVAVAGADVAGARGWPSLFRFAPLRTLGKYSYAMYVFHKPLHDYLGKPLVAAFRPDLPGSVLLCVAYIAGGVLVSLAVAWVSWHLYEKHFLRLKRRFAPDFRPA
jgi:peptidoglycan/LPS O-acetylase OafA/YrhL